MANNGGVGWRAGFLAALLALLPLLSPAASFAENNEINEIYEECTQKWEAAQREEKRGNPENAFAYLDYNISGCPKSIYPNMVAAAKRLAALVSANHIKGNRWEKAVEVHERIKDFAGADKVILEGFGKKQFTAVASLKRVAGHALYFKRLIEMQHEVENPYGYAAPKGLAEPYFSSIANDVAADMAAEAKVATKKEIGWDELMVVPEYLVKAKKLNDEALASEVREAFGENAAAAKNAKAIRELAEKRGDFFSANDDLFNLGVALKYYRILPDEAKLKKTQAKAGQLGDATAAKKDYYTAAEYYKLAGDSAKANDAAAKSGLNKKSLEKNYDPKKAEESLKKMKKSGTEKSKFKKEQDDMEKELGL